MLLLHGFTGTPYDLKPLGFFLHEQGFSIEAPLLLGHGRDKEALLKASSRLWLSQAQNSFSRMPPGSIIIGLSMGALLAIIVAAGAHVKPKALVLLSPSLYLDILGESLSLGLSWGVIPKNLVLKKLFGHSDILDPIAKKKCPSLPHMPLKALEEFNELRKMAIRYLPQVSCPIFVAFGQKDSVIDTGYSRSLFFAVKSEVIIKEYPRSKHVITLDYDRHELNNDILAFLKSQISSHRG